MQNEIAASHTTGLKTHVSARESKDSLLDCRSGGAAQLDDGQMPVHTQNLIHPPAASLEERSDRSTDTTARKRHLR